MTNHVMAYLDPGSAGVIVQIIAGGVAAAVVGLKLFGRRILRALHLTKSPPVASQDGSHLDAAP